MIRDSFEDYDYLALLRNAADKLAAANQPGLKCFSPMQRRC